MSNICTTYKIRANGLIFSSPEPKAQGEFFFRSLSVRRPSTYLNDFSSEAPGLIFFKLQIEPSVKGDI